MATGMRRRRLLLQAAAVIETRGSGVGGRGRGASTATIGDERGRLSLRGGLGLISENSGAAGRLNCRSSLTGSRPRG